MTAQPGDGENKITAEAVYFYTPKFYFLDNFSAFTVTIWGVTFPTAEHAYQWKKFSVVAPAVAAQILAAQSPNDTKRISDAHKELTPSSWHDEKRTVMEEILRAKLTQHPKLREKLAETIGKVIYENSPTDAYWGVGDTGGGSNVLGQLWMQLRDELV